jgi:hypothetical protein
VRSLPILLPPFHLSLGEVVDLQAPYESPEIKFPSRPNGCQIVVLLCQLRSRRDGNIDRNEAALIKTLLTLNCRLPTIRH